MEEWKQLSQLGRRESSLPFSWSLGPKRRSRPMNFSTERLLWQFKLYADLTKPYISQELLICHCAFTGCTRPEAAVETSAFWTKAQLNSPWSILHPLMTHRQSRWTHSVWKMRGWGRERNLKITNTRQPCIFYITLNFFHFSFVSDTHKIEWEKFACGQGQATCSRSLFTWPWSRSKSQKT